ncbi:Wadjet anti-phage system protein JetD domain-containing protein, partial [Pseudomonas sp. GW460-13]|uniref:Wadjet anti-phage system protein JetD domain-containing protein n=1 Tax=Pseudomonas sp. GW460-13 TaxID=2070590 RepID=UPI000CA7D49B
ALPGQAPTHDVTLDADSFATLRPGVSRVFMTENETNFLAFPEAADSLVIFGAGYGFSLLAKATWLSQCKLHYWGDIDTHGFAILD